MSEPYVGETRVFPLSYAPNGWMPCDGRLLPIEAYELLFQVCGNTFGGDGTTDFALPDASGPEAEGRPLQLCIAVVGAYPAPG